eukprot:30445-Eustigmatos_ZCMA.PRE.1
MAALALDASTLTHHAAPFRTWQVFVHHPPSPHSSGNARFVCMSITRSMPQGGYDMTIGTSERGDASVDDPNFSLPTFQHLLI